MSSTRTSSGFPEGPASNSRTDPWDSARIQAAWGKVTDHCGEVVGQAVGLETTRAGEDGQAVGLVDPELVVVLGQVGQVGLDVGHSVGIGAGRLELLDRLTGQVTQHQSITVGLLGDPVGRKVDRDTVVGGGRQQLLELFSGGNISVQRHAECGPLSDGGNKCGQT